MPASIFGRAENVGVRRVGEEIFILAPDGDLIVLGNETAVCLWTAVEAGATSTDELTSKLCEEYDVAAEEATLDVADFVLTLIERKVLLGNA